MKNNCKHDKGFYRYFKVTPRWKGHYVYRHDGEYDEENNGGMFETISVTEFKTKYCINCHKKLGYARTH